MGAYSDAVRGGYGVVGGVPYTDYQLYYEGAVVPYYGDDVRWRLMHTEHQSGTNQEVLRRWEDAMRRRARGARGGSR
jgi:hypothetical protein